jgi:glutamate-1-semialdehyde 2,1-aminomutase
VPLAVNRVGSMITAFFTTGTVNSYAEAVASDTKAFATWFNALLEQGVYWPPSQFEAAFISASHGERELETTLAVARDAFRKVAG